MGPSTLLGPEAASAGLLESPGFQIGGPVKPLRRTRQPKKCPAVTESREDLHLRTSHTHTPRVPNEGSQQAGYVPGQPSVVSCPVVEMPSPALKKYRRMIAIHHRHFLSISLVTESNISHRTTVTIILSWVLQFLDIHILCPALPGPGGPTQTQGHYGDSVPASPTGEPATRESREAYDIPHTAVAVCKLLQLRVLCSW